MKTAIFSLALLVGGSLCAPVFAQDNDKSVGQDLKDAGSKSTKATKKGAVKTKDGVVKGATATGHGVKKGTNKAASETEKGADKLKDKTEPK